jgi:Tfp pilus assembly protein PilV
MPYRRLKLLAAVTLIEVMAASVIVSVGEAAAIAAAALDKTFCLTTDVSE